ncbi:OmcA/MtrC family decaheme c-type cytochrome [Ramlibacter sp. RBP-2]|uniref:OmcA/MtrC family decaheme c-type cytochrome n=1 Tax=Ramlibacter lithotrophicus TaxID=2606681 RepID=A0A7X6DFK0_9BURK|nr:OmcA/MtrC family decaheme c-type cytochrome [Ramlibacter lithotrophicus]NKE66237.1 OmcA/MtrC family decaheme c-type cytochrome [Ramlibacter lithotrophicus]
MKSSLTRFAQATIAAITLTLAGCGGSGGDAPPPDTTAPPPATVSVAAALAAAGAQAANDSSVNSTAGFSVLQQNGVAAVTIDSPPKVNFAVFSDGKVVSSVAAGSVSFALAKLVPGSNGEPDKWVSYLNRTETATAGVGPNGAPALASAVQATSEGGTAGQLAYNQDGYYTYTFKADIKDPAQTAGVAFEPGRTHRIVIQARYKNAAGEVVLVNPYFDFTLDSSGKSVAATASQTRKMVDIATCNNCHDKLALHGGGRVDTQYCVVCHNTGTTDANSGNNLALSTMVHKIHAGRMLHGQGEHYTIWGYQNSRHDYSEVGFPQPIRNCVACHDGANPKTPQGDNWKSVPSKEACLSCHQAGTTSGFHATHVTTLKLGASAAAISNSTCTSCHGASSPLSADKVHWVQELANAALYQGRIESVTLKKAATATAPGLLTVRYAVVHPVTGVAYDLREGCSAAATTDSAGTSIVGCNTNYRWDAQMDPARFGSPPNRFGTFTLQVGAETLAGVTADDVTASGAGWAMYRGADDGSHRYTADIQIPAGAKGNLRVLMTGSVAERRLDAASRTPIGAVPARTSADLAYVPVKNAIFEANAATGAASTAAARRRIVSNDACNKCHAILGLPLGAGDKPDFHKGARNNAEGCSVCHNSNLPAAYTLMTDGSTGPVAGDSQLAAGNTSSFLHESYQAKRFIHSIHGGARRSFPFTHCMNVGGEYDKDGSNTAAGGTPLGTGTCVARPDGSLYPGATHNFSAEVAYPARLANCANCHVNDSWKQDRSVLGSVVFKPAGMPGMLDWLVISPKAATCTSCHDAKAVQTHVKNIGGGAFGNFTQNDLLYAGKVFETCEGCHAPGSALGADVVHR